MSENHINNYYLLKRLASKLDERLKGFHLQQCYSLNKSEIVFDFSNGENPFALKGCFDEQSIVYSPVQATHPPKHQLNAFVEVVDRKVALCAVHFQDRSFRIGFEDGFTLVFMIYGRNGNVLLFKNNAVIDLFRKQFEKHQGLLLSDFKTDTPPMPNDYAMLAASLGPIEAIRKTFKGFSPGMILYLEAHDINTLNSDDQWMMIKHLETLITTGPIDVISTQKTTVLTLLSGSETDKIMYSGSDVIEALNQYAKQYFYQKNLLGLRNKKTDSLKANIEKNKRQLAASKLHLYHLENEKSHKHVADIIMANLHNIQPGTEKWVLFDFYERTDIEIAIKRGTSPQKWAEKLYRKAKNQEIEKQKTVERINVLESELIILAQELSETEAITDFKELKGKVKSMENEDAGTALPFRHFTADGYDIYVGKSAANNDELTFGFAHKEDLWLHARDVSGSHVIIKHKQSGIFPKPVIERAGQIAAYYSKSKGSIMSPVIYTLRKFVRKPKGAAHGSVVCEKEKMVMVAPGLG